MSKIICIKEFDTQVEAQVVKSFLISNGIEADVFGDDVAGLRPELRNINPFRLMIREEDKEKAEKLLEQQSK